MGKEKSSVADVFKRLVNTYYNWRKRKEKLDVFLTDNANLSQHINRCWLSYSYKDSL